MASLIPDASSSMMMDFNAPEKKKTEAQLALEAMQARLQKEIDAHADTKASFQRLLEREKKR